MAVVMLMAAMDEGMVVSCKATAAQARPALESSRGRPWRLKASEARSSGGGSPWYLSAASCRRDFSASTRFSADLRLAASRASLANSFRRSASRRSISDLSSVGSYPNEYRRSASVGSGDGRTLEAPHAMSRSAADFPSWAREASSFREPSDNSGAWVAGARLASVDSRTRPTGSLSRTSSGSIGPFALSIRSDSGLTFGRWSGSSNFGAV
eukprot:scaffold38562_cov27-Tisochrysis_lutea.AAC.2